MLLCEAGTVLPLIIVVPAWTELLAAPVASIGWSLVAGGLQAAFKVHGRHYGHHSIYSALVTEAKGDCATCD